MDQFNSIHERLIARWRELARTFQDGLHLACMESIEDSGNLRYLGDTAAQAGIEVIAQLSMAEIGWDGRQFVDLEGRRIASLFKLYPWEWLLADEFGDRIGAMQVIEPAWKMLLSNKALLPILWELYRDHPNLLRASFSPMDGEFVSKPFWSREGCNVVMRTREGLLEAGGPDSDQPLVYQEYYRLPDFGGYHPVIGSWIIGEEAAGIGIREDRSRITGNLSRFVPHFMVKG
jgi:glutathionylspermidine synthase